MTGGRTAALALAVTLGLLGLGACGGDGPADPTGTPEPIPTGSPGRLLGTTALTRDLPTGVRGWRITYATTRDEGVPATSTALVLAADELPSGARPVVAWAHPTTGVARGCAPSALGARSVAATIPGFDQLIAAGDVVVATDYTGLGTRGPHPYLVGQSLGRAVLDSVRAARRVPGLELSPKTVLWGHSEGGSAVLWAGILAPTYARDVRVAGVAGMAPAGDLTGLVDNIRRYQAGAVFGSYVLAAYAAAYPDVHLDDYVRRAARPVLQQLATHCLRETSTLQGLVQSLPRQGYLRRDPLTGPLGERLTQNNATGVIPAPLFVAQGSVDPLVLPGTQTAYLLRRCAQSGNGPLLYRSYPGLDHGTVVAPSSAMVPEVVAWTRDRFAGKTAPSTCRGSLRTGSGR